MDNKNVVVDRNIKLVVSFLSFGLVLAIVMVVVVVGKQRERRERRLLTLSLLQLVGRVYESKNCEDFR